MDANYQYEIFGQYIFLKKLAAGGMAEVYLARPSHRDGNGRVQVVKRVLPHIASHSAFLQMFQQEIRIIMGFNHPHIVQLHEFGHVGSQPFIAMEYIEGKNLKEVMSKFARQKERMPIPMVVSLIAQAAAGLSYAHGFVNKVTGEQLHAIHRDISPHNLLASYDGNLKVIDFGIAKAASSIHEMTQIGVIKGKAAYISPEQLQQKSVNERSDIFALGVVFWEMLTGRRLFVREGDDEMATMDRVRCCERYIIPPSTYNEDIPTDIDSLVLYALRKNPEERIPTARDFQRMLREAMLRYSPNYSYADVGQKLSAIFAEEIHAERENLRRLNDDVQQQLVGSADDKTMTTPSSQAVSGIGPAGATNFMASTNHDTDNHKVDLRLNNIEALLKQKASSRHYFMLAIYIIALVGIKVFEFNFGSDAAASQTGGVTSQSKNQASVTPSNTRAIATKALNTATAVTAKPTTIRAKIKRKSPR